MMIRGVLKKISWQYALGELILIFLGITIAIWFNNWNEEQKLRKIEVKSLIEIKNAIKQDIKDIDLNISGFDKRVLAYRQLLEHIEKKWPLSDSLKLNLSHISGVTIFLSNTGPYETLKSRGLETISNDSLRLNISLYYDFEFEKLQVYEDQHYEHFITYIKPMAIKRFKFWGNGLEPLNYEQLLKDNAIKQSLTWALRTDNAIFFMYKELKKIGMALIEDLDKEIDRLN